MGKTLTFKISLQEINLASTSKQTKMGKNLTFKISLQEINLAST